MEQEPSSPVEQISSLEGIVRELEEVRDCLPNYEARAAVTKQIYERRSQIEGLRNDLDNDAAWQQFERIYTPVRTNKFTDNAGKQVQETVYYSAQLNRAAIRIKAEEGSTLGFRERMMIIDDVQQYTGNKIQ